MCPVFVTFDHREGFRWLLRPSDTLVFVFILALSYCLIPKPHLVCFLPCFSMNNSSLCADFHSRRDNSESTLQMFTCLAAQYKSVYTVVSEVFTRTGEEIVLLNKALCYQFHATVTNTWDEST